MTDTTLPTPGLRSTLRHLWQDQRVWLASALILAALAVFDAPQAADSALFAGNALLGTAPFLILSIAIAAWANATGADNLIARVSTAEQNQAIGRRKSRPLGAAGVERREGVARPEFLACSVGVFVGVSLPFGRGFGRDDSCRRSSRGC